MLTHWNWLGSFFVLVACVGCGRGPTAPLFPEIHPQQAAVTAIELYDRTGDGFLDRAELTACPPLAAAMSRLDADHDNRLSVDEIHGRIEDWISSGTSLVELIVEVTLNGKALKGAKVSIEPEPFLGTGYSQVIGTTDAMGVAAFRGHDPRLPGVHLGFYRVRISSSGADGKELVPAEYNKDTRLGIEVAGDKSNLKRFDLKSI